MAFQKAVFTMKNSCTVLLVALAFLAGRFSHEPPADAQEGEGDSTPSCGDLNGDGSIDISDGVYLISNLFLGGPGLLCPKPTKLGLPDTGQTTCDCTNEAACSGQDGTHQRGCSNDGRFVDNGDGTVTDNCTGLMWLQRISDVDGDGDLSAGDSISWCGALSYCDTLEVAGHSDWRLPNVRELQSIFVYDRNPPLPVLLSQPVRYEDRLWSSTSGFQTTDGFERFAYSADHAGRILTDQKDLVDRFVRAVRTIHEGD